MKMIGDELGQGVDGKLGVGPLRDQFQTGPLERRERHEIEHALAITFATKVDYANFRLKLAGQYDEFLSGSEVEPQGVEDLNLATGDVSVLGHRRLGGSHPLPNRSIGRSAPRSGVNAGRGLSL
jgi:hypothetical protein